MYLASIGTDLRIYDCDNWKFRFDYGKHDSVLRNIQWSSDGKYILQVNPTGRIEILSATEDGVRSLQHIPLEQSCAASFHRSGHREVAVGCRTGQVFIWDTKFKTANKTLPIAPSPIKLLDFNPKDTFVAAALENGDTIIYSIVTVKDVGVVKVPFSRSVSSLSFHNSFRSLLGLATDEGCILLRDLGVGKDKMFMKDAHNSLVSGIVFSPVNKDVLASCSYDKKMNMYDTRLQIVVNSIQTECALTCVDMNSDSYVALGNKKGEILLFDLRNFSKPIKVFADHKGLVNKVAFQPVVAKTKRFIAIDTSIKETPGMKIVTPKQTIANKTPDSVTSFDFMDQLNSPVVNESLSFCGRGDGPNVSDDSFLVNIIGDARNSACRTFDGHSREFPGILKRKSNDSLNVSKFKTTPISGDSKLSGENASGYMSTVSTPISANIPSVENVSPSPISKSARPDFDINENPNAPKYHNSSIKKFGDSVDSASTVETVVKGPSVMVQELSNELKDFIRYSMYDVVEECRNNFLHMTIEQTKNQLFLEDQLAGLSQKLQSLQQSQSVLIEENQKLCTEVEMLRAAKK